MKILYILKAEPEDIVNRLIAEHKKDSEVLVFELYKDKDYDLMAKMIEDCDRVIAW
ncbi:MAG: hypothetical protein QMD01_07235 [Thermodesulfovibrionales bacterium]|nr:hypothetical protein [Thermodesulfovibrionales bacterium]